MAIDAKHYIPILKAKAGEFQALTNLAAAAKHALTPLLEIVPIPWDYENEAPAKDLDAHLAPLPQKLLNAWGNQQSAFADLFYLEDEGQASDGRHPVQWLFDESRDRGMRLIPVTGLTRNVPYQTAVRDVILADHRGCCIRLILDDLAQGVFPVQAISQLSATLGVPMGGIDLVIDLGPISEELLGSYKLMMPALVQTASAAANWRSFIVTASAFPMNLSDFDRDTISTTPRTEWSLWSHLFQVRANLPRVPTFGDYSIQHPEQPEVDPRIIKMSHSIRYTCESNWLVVKGHAHKKGNAPQYRALCQQLTAMPQPPWRGAGFSWGDTFIEQCAQGQEGPGSATTWRAVGTNHHLTHVCDQIANLPAI